MLRNKFNKRTGKLVPEYYKTLLREVFKYLREKKVQGNISCSWAKRLNIVNMEIISKLYLRFHTLSIKTLESFFV